MCIVMGGGGGGGELTECWQACPFGLTLIEAKPMSVDGDRRGGGGGGRSHAACRFKEMRMSHVSVPYFSPRSF